MEKELYRQAYLIIAHRYDETFKTLLRMLDSDENDIYVHMDLKNKQFDEDDCRKLIKKSGIYFTKRTSVTWGGYSQINSELVLLQTATAHRKYNYYHLLSGQDLPIKANNEIMNFFKKHQGAEFVAFDKETFDCDDRVRYFYPLQEMVGRNRRSFLGRISSAMTLFQKIAHLKRNAEIQFQKGPNWFSITDDLARYVIKRKEWIKKVFHHSICCDEIFLQTIVINSMFADRIYQYAGTENTEESAMRLVDWERGGPYVFKNEDYSELLNSNMIFARKFDCQTDSNIVNKLYAKEKQR